MSTLRLGLVRVEHEAYVTVPLLQPLSGRSMAKFPWQINLRSKIMESKGLDASESLAPDVVLAPQLFDTRSP